MIRRPPSSTRTDTLFPNPTLFRSRAAFFPRISLTAAFGTLSSGLSNLFGNGSDFWSVTPAASLPIFDSGRNRGNLRYAQATRDAMIAQYERTIQSGFREVADALARRGTITAQLEAQASLRDAAAGAYQLSEARFRARSAEHTSELQSIMRIKYDDFVIKK